MSQARTIAADLLNRLQDRRHTLDQLLDRADSRIACLNRADRLLSANATAVKQAVK